MASSGQEEFGEGHSAKPQSDWIENAFSGIKEQLAAVLHEQIVLRRMMTATMLSTLGVLILVIRLQFMMPR